MPPYLKCSGPPVAVFAPASCRPSTPDQRYQIIGSWLRSLDTGRQVGAIRFGDGEVCENEAAPGTFVKEVVSTA